MKTCQEIAEQGTDYLEGAVSPVDWAQIKLHLMLCAPCREYLRQIELSADALRAMDTDEVPRDVKSGLMEAFAEWTAEGQPVADPFDETEDG